jgi:hypothetical protein
LSPAIERSSDRQGPKNQVTHWNTLLSQGRGVPILSAAGNFYDVRSDRQLTSAYVLPSVAVLAAAAEQAGLPDEPAVQDVEQAAVADELAAPAAAAERAGLQDAVLEQPAVVDEPAARAVAEEQAGLPDAVAEQPAVPDELAAPAVAEEQAGLPDAVPEQAGLADGPPVRDAAELSVSAPDELAAPGAVEEQAVLVGGVPLVQGPGGVGLPAWAPVELEAPDVAVQPAQFQDASAGLKGLELPAAAARLSGVLAAFAFADRAPAVEIAAGPAEGPACFRAGEWPDFRVAGLPATAQPVLVRFASQRPVGGQREPGTE